MSGRPTADIVADLRHGHAYGIGGRLDNEAADRLVSLEGELVNIRATLADLDDDTATAEAKVAELQSRHDALFAAYGILLAERCEPVADPFVVVKP